MRRRASLRLRGRGDGSRATEDDVRESRRRATGALDGVAAWLSKSATVSS